MTKITQEAITAACAATVLGEDENYKPVHLEPREARIALEAALPFLAPIAGEGHWLPIAQADRTITDVQDFSEVGITLRNSDHYWVRDDDGRVYEASWTDDKDGYWWDWEAESPVDPIEFMPHPLDPRFSALISSPGKDGGQEVEAVAHIVTDPKGKRRVTLATQYDPMASSFWEHGTMPTGYSVTPLYTRPYADAVIERLTKALAGFAEAADVFEREYGDQMKPYTSCNIKFSALCEARSALAALKAKSPSSDRAASEGWQPEGWTLAPIVPTQKMIDAGKQWSKPSYIYDAMLEVAPPVPDGWHPIETASKDGTEYLLITKDDRQYVGRFRLGSFGEPQLHEIAWRCSSSGRFSNPAAWRPLPAPPAIAEAKGSGQ